MFHCPAIELVRERRLTPEPVMRFVGTRIQLAGRRAWISAAGRLFSFESEKDRWIFGMGDTPIST
jgi:hypothetical protein